MRRHTRNLQVNKVENRECWGLSNNGEGRGLQLNLQEGGGRGLFISAACIALMLLLSSPILLLLLLLLLLLPAATVVATVHGCTVALLLGVAAITLHRGLGELRGAEHVSTVRLLIATLLIALLLPGGSLLHALRIRVCHRCSIWSFDICKPHLQEFAFKSELI